MHIAELQKTNAPRLWDEVRDIQPKTRRHDIRLSPTPYEQTGCVPTLVTP